LKLSRRKSTGWTPNGTAAPRKGTEWGTKGGRFFCFKFEVTGMGGDLDHVVRV
jgi:hypothetical protein